MIVVTAQLWPEGSQANSSELLNATITNQGHDDKGDNYFAHVLARPAAHLGIIGYEADIEVREHNRQAGLTPLLMAVLATAYSAEAFTSPPARTLSRLTLTELHEFDKQLKGRR